MDNHVAAELARLTTEVVGLRGDVGELAQKVDKTNGRVRRLELGWAALVGAMSTLTLAGLDKLDALDKATQIASPVVALTS